MKTASFYVGTSGCFQYNVPRHTVKRLLLLSWQWSVSCDCISTWVFHNLPTLSSCFPLSPLPACEMWTTLTGYSKIKFVGLRQIREIQGRSTRLESGIKGKGRTTKIERRAEGKRLKLELFSYKRFSENSRVRILHGQHYRIQEILSWGISFILKIKHNVIVKGSLKTVKINTPSFRAYSEPQQVCKDLRGCPADSGPVNFGSEKS